MVLMIHNKRLKNGCQTLRQALQGGMLKLSITFIFVFLTTFNVSAEACDKSNSQVYPDYISALKSSKDSIFLFNLKFLASELKANGIKDENISKNISSYTLTLDEYHKTIKILGIHQPKGYNCSLYIYKTFGAPKGYGEYVFARIMSNKLINLSFETSDSLFNDIPVSQLLFTGVR